MRPSSDPVDASASGPRPRELDIAAVHAAELSAAREKIENLEVALFTARKIGTAVGVVMATYKVDDEAAFDILVMVCENRQRTLRDVAEDVVATGTLNWGTL